jgi:DNA-binding LacI/PurR family transcriptional regulator
MSQGVTLKSLAKELGLSVSAVSKALRHDPQIGPATAERVRVLAEARQYVPNQAARYLKQSRNFKIGVIIPDLFDQFYALALRGIEDTAASHRYAVVFAQTHEQPDRERDLIETMLRNRIDGLLLAVSTGTEQADFVDRLEAVGIPVVFFVRAPRHRPGYSVTANSRAGSRQAVEYLYRKGHRRIGHLRGPDSLILSEIRYEGYRQALHEAGLPVDPVLVESVDLSAESTGRAMHRLLTQPNPPTAVLTFKSYVTLDAISFMQREHPHQPHPLDFIGFGNLPLLRYIDYRPLAAIDADPVELGAEAFRLLLHRITTRTDLPEPDRHITMPCHLTVY